MATRPTPTAPVRPPRPKRGRPQKRGVTVPATDHPWHDGQTGPRPPSAQMLALIAADDEPAIDAVAHQVKLLGPARRLSAEGQLWVAEAMVGFREYLRRRNAVDIDYRELRRLAAKDDL